MQVLNMGWGGLKRIISGGQRGVDRGALATALSFGVATGGCAPLGWRTASGSAPELGSLYGLYEHTSPDYPPRTKENVLAGDGTLLLYSDGNSAGTVLTRRYCIAASKPFFELQLPKVAEKIGPLIDWIIDNEIEVLNVAGNHERATYHEEATMDVLSAVFMELEARGLLVFKDP